MTPGDAAALGELYRAEYARRVNRLARTRGTAEAEDIVSQSFAILARRVELGATATPALLETIYKGLLVDAARHAEFADTPVGLLPELDGVVHGDTFLNENTATFPDDFDGALRGLGEAQRDAFILTELRGLTVREAAEVVGVTHPTILARREAATSAIREEIS